MACAGGELVDLLFLTLLKTVWSCPRLPTEVPWHPGPPMRAFRTVTFSAPFSTVMASSPFTTRGEGLTTAQAGGA